MTLATSASAATAESVPALRHPSPAKALPPPVRFVESAERDRVCADAERARAIVLRPPMTTAGEVRRALDADLESALAVRGAVPASVDATASYDEVVADQVLRAATLPVRGICVALPVLPRDAEGMVAESDAKALAVWVEAARKERRIRLVVMFDALDRAASIRVPQSLETWLDPAPVAHATLDSMPPSGPRSIDLDVDAASVDSDEDDVVDGGLAEALLANDAEEEDDALVASDGDDEGAEVPDLLEVAAPNQAEADAIEAAEALPPLHAPTLRPAAEEEEDVPLVDDAPSEAELAAEAEAAVREAEALAAERERAARLVDAATWRSHALELDEARGPRPVSMIEKLFTTRYLPLMGAMSRGETDQSVRTIVDLWRQSFADSYEAAYGSLRVTGKRPTMVMDAPDVAMKIGRLSSARSVKLVLVDSMSYDLGDRVAARVGAALQKRAALVEKNILWAALPSTTPMQMHLIGRGAEGLKDPPAPASLPDVSRGRAVATFRREKLGARELLKLDVVEARLRNQGASYDERLEAIADEVADLLIKLFDSLPPRTLVYVFGDHGFVLPHGTNGWETGASTQGGASPEEVLVGGQAWLIDAVQ
jgi:hypothetical protein